MQRTLEVVPSFDLPWLPVVTSSTASSLLSRQRGCAVVGGRCCVSGGVGRRRHDAGPRCPRQAVAVHGDTRAPALGHFGARAAGHCPQVLPLRAGALGQR